MANIVFAYDNLIDAATLSGGSWVAGLPLNNLKDFHPKKVARSSGATAASTQLLVDFGYSAPLQLIALLNDNLSDAATVRFRAGPNANGSSALIDETLTAGDFGDYVPASGRTLFYLHSEIVYARYILVEIAETTSPDLYVQFGRMIAGRVFQPDLNLRHGAQLSLIDESRTSKAVDGSQWTDVRPKRRRISGEFQVLTKDEGLGQVYDLQWICGVGTPLLVVFDPDLTGDDLGRTAVYGLLVSIDPIVTSRPAEDGDLYSWRFAVEEQS
jgi:hypothetical protein